MLGVQTFAHIGFGVRGSGLKQGLIWGPGICLNSCPIFKVPVLKKILGRRLGTPKSLKDGR